MKKTLLLLLLFLPSIAFSQIAVEITPLQGSNSLYAGEKAEFAATVINTSDFDIDIVGVELSASDNLAIFHDLDLRKYKYFSFSALAPGEKRNMPFEVIARSAGEGKITASFGSKNLDSSSSLKIDVSAPPVDFSAKNAASKNGKYSVAVALANNSVSKIENVKIFILPAESLELESDPLLAGVLDSNKVLSGELIFSARKKPSQIIVRASFDDAKGKHVLEKRTGFAGLERSDLIVGVIVLAILLLVGFHFFLKPKHGKNGHTGHGHDSKGASEEAHGQDSHKGHGH